MNAAAPATIVEPALLADVTAIARAAGAITMEYYRGDYEVERKDDHSPVTAADQAADALIAKRLRALTPDVPVVTEEEEAAGLAPTRVGARFWLVDPLDGTKEFIHHRDEFTVNIALIEAGRPVLGVVFAPAKDVLYTAAGAGTAQRGNGDGALRPIAARAAPDEGITVVASRSHANKTELEHYLADKTVTETVIAGSSFKFGLVAEGVADVYPRFGPTMEWDTAAGHAVIDAAGGHVRTLDGKDLRYGKPSFRNPHFIASGR